MTVRKYTSRSQQTTLTSAVTSGATSITVLSASNLLGGIAASDITGGVTFTVVLDPDTALEEIVDITAASSNTFTITRSVDAVSTAQDHSAGAVVRHMVIGRDLREANTHTEASSSVHGLVATSGVVVGTLATQTLTNKTFTTPTINGATLSGTITSTATVSGGTITGAAVTGLSAPSAGSDATTKTYVDSILGSATAASTSASSAATSASSAATSATSAATQATAAATSATSAATSRTSSLTSQTAAATSATSAAASATAAATSATSAAASATAAATSATSAAASATAAASSATTAAASVATIATYASNASTSASSAATSASLAATSATSAAASTSAAATSASSAATSASSTATSATSAANSATAASTSATSAATQATAAATSATSAANSATAAATSATSAAASATAAAASYDSFDDRYLGDKSTAPSVDNDGNALLTGALYFNTSVNAMYVWTGSAWTVMATSGDISAVYAGTGLSGGGASGDVTVALDTSSVYVVPSQSGASGKYLTSNGTSASWGTVNALPSQSGNTGKFLTTDGSAASWSVVAGSLAQPTEPSSPSDGQIWIDTDGTAPLQQIVRWSKAPSSGTTSLTGTDDNSVTLAYTAGYEQVYLNGVLLSRGTDYTATSGTSITLATGTATGDLIEVIGVTAVGVTDVYTQSQTDAKYVPKNLTTTTGDIIYASAANTPARLGIGSSGQVLGVSGGVPAWQAAPASGMNLITRSTFSNVASFTLDNIFTSTYDNYVVILDNLYGNTSTTADMYFRLRYGSTTYAPGNNYYGHRAYWDFGYSQTEYYNMNNVGEFNIMDVVGASTGKSSMTLNFSGVGNTTELPKWHGTGFQPNFGAYAFGPIIVGGAVNEGTINFTGLYLFASATNITGTISVYGLAKA